METATKEDSLYIAVKQEVFDDIVSGKQKEFRYEIRDTTFLRLLKTVKKEPVYDPAKISSDNELSNDPMVYNNGVFPFYLKEYQTLSLAVGFAKLRDSATINIKTTKVVPARNDDGSILRLDFDEDGNGHPDPNGRFTIWTVIYQLGKIINLTRKNNGTTKSAKP